MGWLFKLFGSLMVIAASFAAGDMNCLLYTSDAADE